MTNPVAQLWIDLRAGIGKLTTDLSSATKVLKKTERQFKTIGTNMSLALTAPLAGLATLAVREFSKFEVEMVKVGQKAQATGEELDSLKKSAIELGAKTQFSTAQAAEGMKELAASGFNTTQIIKAMPGVLGLASVAEIGVGEAAKTTSTLLKQFSMKAEDAGMVSDVLAKAADLSAVSVADLAESFKYAGTNADMAGVPFKEVAAALAIMGNKGIAADTAGTNLRMGFARLLKPTKQVKDALSELNIPLSDLTNENGTLKSLPEILARLNNAGIKSSQVFKIFGTEASGGWSALLKTGAPALDQMIGKLNSATGYTESFRQALSKTLSMKWEQFTGAISALATNLGGILAPTFKAVLDIATIFVDKLVSLTSWFSELPQPIQNATVVFLGLTAAIGPVLFAVGSLAGLLAIIGAPLAATTVAFGLVTAAAVAFASALVSFVTSDGFVGWLIDTGERAKDLWNKIRDSFDAIITKLDSWKVQTILAFDNVKIALRESGEAVKDFVLGAIDWFDKLATKIQNSLIGEFGRTVKQLKGLTNDAGNYFKGLYDDVVGHSYIPDMVEAIGDWMGGKLVTNMVKPAQNACMVTSDSFEELGTKVTKSVDKLVTDIGSKITPLQGMFSELFGMKAGDKSFGGDLLGSLFGDGAGADSLGGQVGDSLLKGLDAALNGGNGKQILGSIGEGVGETIGGSVGGPLGAQLGKTFGKQFGEDLTKIGKSKSGTLSTLVKWGGVGPLLPDSFYDKLFSSGRNPDTQARKGVEKYLEDLFGKSKFKFFDSQGMLKQISDFTFGASSKFNDASWADTFNSMSATAQSSFNAVGFGLTKLAGVASNVAPQIASILAENFGGSADAARMLFQQLGLSAQDLEQQFIDVGKTGEMSWHEVEVALQGVAEASKPGLTAVGDFATAFNNVINSAGRGEIAITSLKSVAIEAMEAGSTSLSDLQGRLAASGQFTQEQIRILFQALSQRGITSLKSLADVSDRVGGGIIADMESLGIKWGDVQAQIQGVKSALDALPMNVERNLTFKINTTMDSNTMKALDGGILSSSGSSSNGLTIPAFANGGIVSRPTLGLIGEAGPEVVIPKNKLDNLLNRSSSNRSGSSGNYTVVVNAPNSDIGAADRIRSTIMDMKSYIVNEAVNKVYDNVRRSRAY